MPAFLSRFLVFFLASAHVFAVPVISVLDARATASACEDGNASPCICDKKFGLRKKTLECGTESFQFTDAKSSTDGTVKLVNSNQGSLQCDQYAAEPDQRPDPNSFPPSIVELQFIAEEIGKVPGICTHFTTAKTGKSDFEEFFKTINTVPNLVFVESTVNNAKGIIFGGKSFSRTSAKAASGLVSYLTELTSNGNANKNPGNHVATTIDAAMTKAVGAGNGFTGFQSLWDTAVSSAITEAEKQVKQLAPAPTPGDPFVNESSSTIAKCTTSKRSLWEQARDFVVRAATGKKATTSAAKCELPSKSTATAKAKAKTAKKKASVTKAAKKPAPTVKKAAATKAAKKTKAVKKTKATKKTKAVKKTKAAKKPAPTLKHKTVPKKTSVKKTTKKTRRL
ncbi:DJ-1 protein-PfpI domain-containing protein [Mycena chlorophos]|uniref:DJ-1 protein-PfpI domain-containing protein n=1 Tax=Mycena chlorophos TaxID=658473 RepID=A0A8H6VSI1_MYCCL|nr:DJ-1 protein-PfpI domain-containing protein [Mycena chlorophos]